MNDMLRFFQDSVENTEIMKQNKTIEEQINSHEFRCPKCRNSHYRTVKLQSVPTSFSKESSDITRFNVYVCTSCGFSEMYAE